MKKGLEPIKRKDHRTYDFHRTFGSITTQEEFNFDWAGQATIFPDQNLDGMPQACTAYTENDIASNDDHIYYDDQLFTYLNTKLLEGVTGEVPVSQMDAMKAGTVYGVKKKIQTPDEALENRRAPYFIIKKNPDYYDGLLSAMQIKQGCLDIGTPWLPEFERVGSDGVIPDFTPPKDFSEGHNWSAVGQKIVNGEPRIICKSWQGRGFGDNGYCYFNRKQINDLLSVKGSGAFVQKHAAPDDIKNVQMSLFEAIISFLWQIVEKLQAKPIIMPPASIVPVKRDLLTEFCNAIADYEGGPGDLNHKNNNPGNCRFSSVGYDPKYGVVKKDSRNFAIFKDWDTGFLYLKNLVRGKAEHRPTDTIGQFMARYAPVEDNNDPVKYAAYIEKRLGVDNSFKMGDLLT